MFKVLIEFYFVKVAIERKTVAKFSKMKIIKKKIPLTPIVFVQAFLTHVTFKALLKDSTSTILRPPSGQLLIIISSFILSFFPFQKSEQKSLFVSLIVALFVGSEENNKPRDLTLSFCHLKFLSGARISFFSVFEPIHWRIQGRGPEALHPLIFRPQKSFLGTRPPLPPPPSFISGCGSGYCNPQRSSFIAVLIEARYFTVQSSSTQRAARVTRVRHPVFESCHPDVLA